MNWLSVNPRLEAKEDVTAAAKTVGVKPEDITPQQLADGYNIIEAAEKNNLDQLLDGVFDAFSDND